MIDDLNVPFNDNGFHFNKSFLNDEIFIEQKINNKVLSLLYNKFPFADYHGLLVIDKHRHYNQFLFTEIFIYIWCLYQKLSENIIGLVIAYNSLGAGASVNHLHFQSSITLEPYSIESNIWMHNGGNEAYPVKCMVFNDVNKAWNSINNLQNRQVSFNLIFKSNKLYCLPQDNTKENKTQLAWFEMAGNFVVSDEDVFEDITDSKIVCQLKSSGLN